MATLLLLAVPAAAESLASATERGRSLARILDVVFVIIASLKASNGEHYRYPFALRLIK